jgi:enoyl-CoA hydratase/carnithine racemase
MNFVEVSSEAHITTVRMNRPDALNAISGAMAEELAETFREVSDNTETWVMVLAAAGDKAFCVGADLKERARFDLDEYHRNRQQIRSLFAALRGVAQPTIAAAFGYALGGGFELALSCDFIVAAEGSEFGLPEASVGLLPAGGGTQLLARRLGPTRAKEMIFTADRIGAEEAMEIGLLTDIVPKDNLEENAFWLAREICKSSPIAVRAAKRAIDLGLGRPVEEGIEVEHESWKVVIESEDRSEGIAAFNEKRDPEWKNR